MPKLPFGLPIKGWQVSPERVNSYFKTLGSMPEQILVDRRNSSISLAAGISEIIESTQATHHSGGKVIFVGNGGSAAIASHMANDYPKNGRIRAICFSDPAQLTCLSNDYGYDQVFCKAIEMLAQPQDLLMAISSSGKSPNILNAVEAAQATGCKIITLSGFNPENPLRKMGQINFYVPSSAYGFVELTHLIICHLALDLICEQKNDPPLS